MESEVAQDTGLSRIRIIRKEQSITLKLEQMNQTLEYSTNLWRSFTILTE
jgi:hypothetical protein